MQTAGWISLADRWNFRFTQRNYECILTTLGLCWSAGNFRDYVTLFGHSLDLAETA